PRERHTHFAKHAPHEKRVAVPGPHERSSSVVEVPERSPAPTGVAKDRYGEVRPLEVLCPFGIVIVDAQVKRLQCIDLPIGRPVVDDYDEVGVAVLVEVSDGERALKVRADKIVAQRAMDFADQTVENGIEVAVWSRMAH